MSFLYLKNIKYSMLLFLFFVAIFGPPHPSVWGQQHPVTEETREFCNKILVNIYYDLVDLKKEYPGLKNFGDECLFENPHGIYALLYEYKGHLQKQDRRPYAFGITIDKTEDATFNDKDGVFQYPFPALDLKINGFQPRYILSSELDVTSVIRKYIPRLQDYQQSFLPLRLIILPTKNLYHVHEEIELEIVLKNVSKNHLYVKTLGPETLYFLFNNEFWGTRPTKYTKGGKRLILHAGEELRVSYRSDGFPSPRDVNIYCTYNVEVDGVHPYTNYQIKIIE